MTDDSLTLSELSDLAETTPRTIRYYIKEGLLPSPGTRGPGAHYDVGYVDRLRLIRRLQEAHLPLSEIASRIGGLGDDEVREVLNAPSRLAADSAADYVRSVLATRGIPPPADAVFELRSPMGIPATSHWERIAIDPDIELHVRQPLSRHRQGFLKRLQETIHDLLDEEPR